MSTYAEYTKIAAKELCLVFRCTHCGFKTAFQQPFGKKVRYRTGQNEPRPDVNRKKEEANAELNDWKQNLLQETRRVVYEQRLLPCDAHIACPNCAKVPDWSYKTPLWSKLLKILGYILLIFAFHLFVASLRAITPSGMFFAIGVGIVSLPFFLIGAVYKSAKFKNALKIDRSTLPIVCGSPEEAREVLDSLDDPAQLNAVLKQQQNVYSGSAKSMLTLQFASGVKKAVVYFAGDEFKITKTTEQVYPVIANSYLIVKANNCEDSEQILIKAKKDTVIEVFCTKTDTYLKVLSQKTAEQYL